MYSTPPICKRNPRRRADQLVNAARRRYRRLAPTARPGPQPWNLCGLFTSGELFELWSARRWPLSAADLHFVIGRRVQPDVSHEGLMAQEAP